MRAFFRNDGFQFATEGALGGTYHRTADVGEVLATVGRIPDGKAEAWVREWSATADRVLAEGEQAEKAGHPRSAAARYLRASHYYARASDNADDSGFAAVWEKHRAAWDRWVATTEVDVEPITIPYEDTTLPGYFFRSGPGPRRTLIFTNGSDGPVVGAWAEGIADALERGWNAMTYDGPGQNAALVRQGIPFRPDWEKVLTPVVDVLVGRPDVDPARLAVLGVSQAGFWVTRAVAFEHRIAAAVVDPGVVDVSAAMLGHLPHSMVALLDAGEKAKFDKEMAWAARFSASLRTMLAWRMRPYGVTSPFDFFTAARAYTVDADTIAAIRCPVIVTDPEHEQFWPGQARRLYDALTGPKTLLTFTAEEGADGHCEPVAAGLRGERIFDALDELVAA